VKRLGAALALAALAAFSAATAVAQRRDAAAAARRARGVEGTGPAGSAALYRWAASTGRGPLRVAGEGAVAPGAVWVLAAPAAPLGPGEAEAFLAHVRAGGLAVWALGPEPQPELAARLGLSVDPLRARSGLPQSPLAPHPLFRGLSLRGACQPMASTLAGALPVAGADAGALPCTAVFSIPVGRGEVLVLAGDDLLANRAVGDADHLAFWARVAERGPLAFDERYLGARSGPGVPRGIVVLLAQAALAAALAGWALLPRFGAVRPPPAEDVATGAAGYLTSLAALYGRARAEPELVRTALASLRARARERAGVPRDRPDAEVARFLARKSPEAARAFAAAAVAGAASAAGRAELVRITQASADLEAALGRRARRG